jgi:hypothetical protein
MAKQQKTYHGAYSRDDLGTHGGAPLKVVEMDRERTRPKTVADGVSWAARLDEVSCENGGLAGKIKRR